MHRNLKLMFNKINFTIMKKIKVVIIYDDGKNKVMNFDNFTNAIRVIANFVYDIMHDTIYRISQINIIND